MIQKVIKQSYCSLISSSSNSCNDHIISSQISSSNFFLSMTFFFLNPTNELIKWAFHKLLLGCLFASGSSKKKKKRFTPTRVLFIFLPKCAYMLHATFRLQDATTTTEYQDKRARAWRLCYKIYIKKRW